MTPVPVILFLANLAATLFMTGVIWFVQVVHYPLFARVGEARFARYEAEHVRRTGYVVMPPMLLELATALLLLWTRPTEMPFSTAALGAVLVAAIWIATFTLQTPQHAALSNAFEAQAHRVLTRSNWIRTMLWSWRSLLLLWAIAEVAG